MIFENDVVEEFTIPTIENVPFKPIEKKYITVILLNYSILLTIFFTLIILAVFLLNFSFSDITFLVLVTIIFTILLVSFVFSLLGFSKRQFAVRSKDISYKKGLLTTTLTTVPFKRVQHIDVKQGFFSRKLN